MRERNWMEVFPWARWGGADALPPFQPGQTFHPSELLLKEARTLSPSFDAAHSSHLPMYTRKTAHAQHFVLASSNTSLPEPHLALHAPAHGLACAGCSTLQPRACMRGILTRSLTQDC